ncbi:MAG: hypothetical protein IJE78_00450 [Bacteroidaceae bacterium]|nr:hypothetical protein [Bacteroidaceae bacterium]MBQ2855583.1 hypothetical protein [Bacteroidaceae bacterium]
MYGCNCHIGCLSGSVTRVGDGLRGRISRIGSDGNETFGLSGSVTRVGDGLRGYASLVCSTNKDAYLRVVPDVVWLTPDMLSGEFDIYSNVVWRID